MGDRDAKDSMTRRVTDGDNNDSPAATSRIARNMSAGSVSLIRKPAAPACRASKTYSSSSKVVSMITRTPARDGSPTIIRNAAIPSSCGIRMSIKITSGRVRRASSTACRPFSASPASSRSSSDSMRTRRPIRTSG